ILAAFLINKNTPKPALSDVRFSPPTSPSFDSQSTAPKRSGREEFLAGVGIIEPAGEAVAIGSQLQGIVYAVLVKPGDRVEIGQPLFVLDDRTAKANVGIATVDLAAQEAKLAEALAQIETQKARVDAAMAQNAEVAATLANGQLKLMRAEKLLANNSISAEEFDLNQLNLRVAEARVAEAAAKYREAVAGLKLVDGESGAPSIEVQKAAVEQAKAMLVKEQVTLDQHTIRAPSIGTVLQVRIRAGEFVPATVLTNPVITLGVINPLHIRVDIDETEIARFKETAAAFAAVRGRAERQVPISFVGLEPLVTPKKSLTGGVSERVDTRVLQIIYSVEPSEIDAIPGQQVDVYIEDNPRD
ncbi:MAG: biotin/lipoyl-binding protein, partial [Planctomycetales bacterium]|nr:biotin/lipoyl-binding protein [Planctomycetales bacterium]